jgi:hypothetical protein
MLRGTRVQQKRTAGEHQSGQYELMVCSPGVLSWPHGETTGSHGTRKCQPVSPVVAAAFGEIAEGNESAEGALQKGHDA